ncbi:hypothetical protein VKT23_017052 [Stygiomarasmius scandens]|uniref:Uncharacterized protein n=1 Tax=Marasmiellus scandens TaxID=2682957 RepID=A0ABR1IT40_9AGAR
MNNTASPSEAATLAAISPSRAVVSSPESDRNEPDTTAAQDPQQGGEAPRVSTPGSVHRQSEDASADKEHTEDSNVSQQPTRAGNTVKKEENRGILPNLSRYQSSYTGNRDYDYEKKYPSDPYGAEAGEDARVWKVYLDEAEAYDDEMLKGFRDTINSLLVF